MFISYKIFIMKKIITPILFLLLVMSCEEDVLKNKIDDSADALEVINDYTIINQVFQDVGNTTADAIFNAETTINGKISTVKEDPVITIEPLDFTTFPKTITIDFQSGTLGSDGVTRKGIVTVVSTNWYGKDDSEHTTTFSDYYHDDYKVEGTHYTKNLGENEDDNLEFSVKVTDGKITSSTTGESITFTSDSKRTWVSGADTPLNIWDDEYKLEGSHSGTGSNDVDYTMSTTEALHFVLSPRSVKSGILSLSVGNINNIELNYNTSTVTILGVTFPVPQI